MVRAFKGHDIVFEVGARSAKLIQEIRPRRHVHRLIESLLSTFCLRFLKIQDVLKQMESMAHIGLIIILFNLLLHSVALLLFLAESRVFCVEQFHPLLNLEIRQEYHQPLFFLSLF